MELGITTARKLLKSHGAERVKKSAVAEYANVLEQYAGFISEEAAYLAEKDGRKTVQAKDIEHALQNTHE